MIYCILEKFEVLLSLKERKKEREEEIPEIDEEIEEEGYVDPEFYEGESLVPCLLPDVCSEDTESIWDGIARKAKMR